MKRFDKGYIYSSLLSDFFGSLAIVFIFLKEIFLNDESSPEDFIALTPIFAIAFVVIYLCFIAYRIMFYKTSGYELTEKEIKCNRGVLFRKRSVLEYKKVHAINKKQNLFHRIFGIAVLTVDSGSTNTSHQAEITIIEKDRVVDELLKELNTLKEGGTRNEESVQPKDELLLSDEDSLYSFTSGKKIVYTLINIASTAFFYGVVCRACRYRSRNLQADDQAEFSRHLGSVFPVCIFDHVGCHAGVFNVFPYRMPDTFLCGIL